MHTNNVNYTKDWNRTFPTIPKMFLLNKFWYENIVIFAEVNYCIYTDLIFGLAWHDNITINLTSPTVLLHRGKYVHHAQQTIFYLMIYLAEVITAHHAIINYPGDDESHRNPWSVLGLKQNVKYRWLPVASAHQIKKPYDNWFMPSLPWR